MEFRNFLVNLVYLLNPKTYIELGVKNGYTFNVISSMVEKAYAVDIVKQSSVRINSNVEFFQGTTADFYHTHKQLSDSKIDFIFIDADHSYEAVLNDCAMMKRFVKPYSGLIFLHDTFPIKAELLQNGYCFNAWQAAKEIRKLDKDLEIVTIPGPWAGLSILRLIPNGLHGWMDF